MSTLMTYSQMAIRRAVKENLKMTKTMDTVAAFYKACGAKDWTKVRSLLADDFTFRGALSYFDSPNAYIEGVSSMPFAGAPVNSRFIVDGTRVAHAFVWKMTAPMEADVPMCEVFEVAGGKIKSSELFYDSKLFPAMS